MGYEELVRHLIRTAETRRDGILARAREKASKIVEDARRTSEASGEDASNAADKESNLARLHRMNRARQEANEMRLRARATVADAVMDRVLERLPLLPGEARYPAIAERLFREILPELPPGNVIVRADGVVRAALESSDVAGRIRFEPFPDAEIGGVEASDEDGRFLLRNTLRSRFEKARPAMLAELGRRLPGPDE